MNKQQFMEVSEGFFADSNFKTAFEERGLNSIDAIFAFEDAKNLSKSNLAKYRGRCQFEIGNNPATTVFLKRYNKPPILTQIKSWLSHHRRASTSFFDFAPSEEIAANGINTPKVIAYGEQWGKIFEKRSFVITEKIKDAESLERKLPDYFYLPLTKDNIKLKKNFIKELACVAKRFHETGFRHRDFYFAHIFYGSKCEFYLIDLARAFKPIIFKERFRVKDIAQLYYSAPGKYFSKSDRLRFYKEYCGRKKMTFKDKIFIRRVKNKVRHIARHDKKHGRAIPYTN